ncbi:MAG: hypothetical protein K2W96_02925 [Gemmataceae bacterium]|nr:hypothetical protein [Gemmataceae bacterium]
MSIRSALVAALLISGAATAAPALYSPEGSAEALLEANTAERAQALANFLRTPEFAAQAAGDKQASAPAWLAMRLKAEVVGTGVRLTMGGHGLREREALASLRAAVRVVTDEPGRSEMARLQAQLDQQRLMNVEMQLVGGKAIMWKRPMIIRGDGRFIEEGMTPQYNASLDIRLNRPTVKGAPRLVVR